MSNYNSFEQNVSTTPYTDPNTAVMSVGDWVVTLLILAIPLAGFIVSIVWAFGNGNISRKNYCRVSLIFSLIALPILGFLFAAGLYNSFLYTA